MDDILFYNKMMLDHKLVELLKLFEKEKWKDFNTSKKMDIFKNVMQRLNLFFPEFGECKFDFAYIGDYLSGENDNDFVTINIKKIEKGNPFDILCICLHELRHFYQYKCTGLYIKQGIIHELFGKKEIHKIAKNNMASDLENADNYYSYENNYYIYIAQPVEYDAIRFSYNIINLLSKKFYSNPVDMNLCKKVCSYIEEDLNLIKINETELINFNKMYSLGYEEYVAGNKEIFESDRKIALKYMKIFDYLDKANENEVLSLFAPCFWQKFSEDKKIKIMDRYLKMNGFHFDICSKDGKVFFDNDEEEFKINDCLAVYESLFNRMADEKIKRICKKRYKMIMDKFEKEIWLNCSYEKNIISKEKNPLFYNIQPFALYKNIFIYDKLNKLFSVFNSIYGDDIAFFYEYDKCIKKYDVKMMMKKAEILTGKSFGEIYQNIVTKMIKPTQR